MQPGKPQGFGHLGNKVPIFCLPGNPVSSLVSFEAFVRPAIRKLLGKRSLHRATVQATALEGATSPPACGSTAAACCTARPAAGTACRSSAAPGSHLLASLALSNCLVVIDEDVTEVVAGSRGHGHAAAAVQPLTRGDRRGADPGLAGRAVGRAGRAAPAAAARRARRGARSGCATSSGWRRGSRPRRTAGPSATRCRRWPPLHSALRAAGRHGTMLPFMIDYGGRLVGQMNVSNIVHGALRSCTVGYWVDGAVAGRGITPTALALVIDHCFARGRPAPGRGRHPAGERAEPARRREAGAAPRGLLRALPRHRRRRGATTSRSR